MQTLRNIDVVYPTPCISNETGWLVTGARTDTKAFSACHPNPNTEKTPRRPLYNNSITFVNVRNRTKMDLSYMKSICTVRHTRVLRIFHCVISRQYALKHEKGHGLIIVQAPAQVRSPIPGYPIRYYMYTYQIYDISSAQSMYGRSNLQCNMQHVPSTNTSFHSLSWLLGIFGLRLSNMHMKIMTWCHGRLWWWWHGWIMDCQFN